jgi:hypothetical protein
MLESVSHADHSAHGQPTKCGNAIPDAKQAAILDREVERIRTRRRLCGPVATGVVARNCTDLERFDRSSHRPVQARVAITTQGPLPRSDS